MEKRKKVRGNKEKGRIGENGRIKENKELASVLIPVKPLRPYSRKSSVCLLSHATCTGTRLSFVTSRLQTAKSL
jgi:hypothetical protein